MHFLWIKIRAVLIGAWRYRWQGLAAAWIVCLIGWLAIWAIPDKYEVEAQVYIDTDTVLGPLMRGLTVPTDQSQQVAIMLRSITTRPNMETIVHLVNPRADKMTSRQMEAAVTTLEQNIVMKPLGVRNFFSIAYVDNNSIYAESVTQSLLSVLVDSNIGDKRRDMEGARSFIDRKISEYEIQLREAEQRRADFKAANLDVISNGGAAGGVDAANTELQTAKNELGNAQVTVASLRSQLAGIPQTVASDQLPTISERGSSGGSSSPMARLREAEQTLLDLQSRYTPNYPDIVSVKQTIAQLQKEVLQADNHKAVSAPDVGVPNPVYVDMRNRLSAAEVALALLEHRVSVASSTLETAKKNTNAMIVVNSKYADLDRDYSVLESNYSQLVKSREAARLSQSMSDQQQSIAFRIIQPPKRTQYPVSPPRLILNTFVLLAGLGAGVGLAAILSIFGGRFSASTELIEYFSLPLLGVVTIGPNASAARKERNVIAVVAGCLISLVVLYAAVAVLLTTSIYSKLGI